MKMVESAFLNFLTIEFYTYYSIDGKVSHLFCKLCFVKIS